MLAYLFVVLAVAMRFISHPFHLTPVGASLLFFGARGQRRYAWIPVLLLAGSDFLLTTRVWHEKFVLTDYLVTWAWYAGMIALGSLLRDNARPLRVASAALAAATSFFVISNFVVWATQGMYPMTLAGLGACYAAGVPFFRNDLVGDLLFSAVMFSIPAVVHALRPAPARVQP